MLIRISVTEFCNVFIFITFRLVKIRIYDLEELKELCSYIMDGSYVLTSETTKKTDLCIFCRKVKKVKTSVVHLLEEKN